MARLGQFGKVLSFYGSLWNSMNFDMSHANNFQRIQKWPNSSSPGVPGPGSWHPDVASMACYGPRWTHDEISWSLTCRKARIRKIDLAAFIRITGIGPGSLPCPMSFELAILQLFIKNIAKIKLFPHFWKAFQSRKMGRPKRSRSGPTDSGISPVKRPESDFFQKEHVLNYLPNLTSFRQLNLVEISPRYGFFNVADPTWYSKG